MNAQSKNVQGQLLDAVTRDILADILPEIVHVQSINHSERPQYQVYGTIKGYRPDLADKSYILKINEKVSGEVSISIHGTPEMEETRFKLYLTDSAWLRSDWFQSL